MRTCKSCFYTFMLWLSCSVCMVMVMFFAYPIYSRVYNQLWQPVGITDSALEQVAGDKFAFTDAGHYYQELSGHWKRVELPVQSGRPIWNMVEGDMLVIANQDGIFYDQIYQQDTLPLPPLTQPLAAIGQSYTCTRSGLYDGLYAASESELALYNQTSETWKAFPLAKPQSALVSVQDCWILYVTPSGELNFIRLENPDNQNQDGLTVGEQVADLTGIGEAMEIGTTSRSVYLLARTGMVWRTSRISTGGITWEALPASPQLVYPHLIVGTAGVSFSEEHAEELVDVWLTGEKGIYWLNRDKQAWEKFSTIKGKAPRALSSLARSLEGSSEVTRLAIVDGKLYRQRPVSIILILKLIFAGIPLLVLLAVPISVSIMLLWNKLHSHSRAKKKYRPI
jgi:hypothetical protein